VQASIPDALIVHRLDMATSGLVVLARGADMQRALSQLFMARRVFKRYEAVVQGLIEADEGRVDAPLITDWPRRPRQMVDLARGKPSLTLFHVMNRDPVSLTTRVSLEPQTGRSHQLRVHLLTLGHPIMGDPLYGPESVRTGASRLLLHACELKLPHPCRDQGLHLHCPSPF
jgi:tRNA pseudouridine32 synthase/23S rRNA pseudouridine746 synthase